MVGNIIPTSGRGLPRITLALACTIGAIFMLQQAYLPPEYLRQHHFYAVPSDLVTAFKMALDGASVMPLFQVMGGFFTALLLHSSQGLLLGNLLFLLLLGSQVEWRLGGWKTLAVFIAGGVLGELTLALVQVVAPAFQAVASASQAVATSGASPGIYALAGAFLATWWHECRKRQRINFPISLSLVAFVVLKDVMAIVIGTPDTFAHSSHMGGLMSGLLLSWFLSREQQPQYYRTDI